MHVSLHTLSEQIPIIRTQISLLRLLIFRQAQIPRTPIPPPILHQDAYRIYNAAHRRQTYERNANTIPRLVKFGFIFRQESILWKNF